ncbi:MAG: aminodeoxychorismate/anthranilate synthase component II [Hymenobacteraceae bacterium]|nr:aminodeoxychorismate/anthranilate synthase component II [Hymenobacteraceae bacterium]
MLLFDNYDSFTYNLLDYFGQLGLTARVVPNDASRREVERAPFRALVLSPGPGTPARAGALMPTLERWAGRVPVLGVCLGLQAIGELVGARLKLAARPMHGMLSEIEVLADGPLFGGLPRRFQVTRYHSLVLDPAGSALRPLAYTVPVPVLSPAASRPPELMAAHVPELQLSGVQFHPEAVLTAHGLAMLGNWARASMFASTAEAPAAATTVPILTDLSNGLPDSAARQV